jgi:hypothetical protein
MQKFFYLPLRNFIFLFSWEWKCLKFPDWRKWGPKKCQGNWDRHLSGSAWSEQIFLCLFDIPRRSLWNKNESGKWATSSLAVITHRNLRTRWKMHLCMQDDQIGRNIMGLTPADMARLPHLVNKKWFLVVTNLHVPTCTCTYVSWDYTYFELALLCKGNRPFLTEHSPSSS